MPTPKPQDLIGDPDFQGLAESEKLKVFSHFYAAQGFDDLPHIEKIKAIGAYGDSSIGPGGPSHISPFPNEEVAQPAAVRPSTFMERPINPVPFIPSSLYEAGLEKARPVAPNVVKVLEGVTPLNLAEAAPGMLATALALASGGASIPATVLAAAVGGMGGVGVKRGAQALAGVPIKKQSLGARAMAPEGIPASVEEDLAELGGEGVKQGAAELLGQGVGKLIHPPPAPDRITKLAQELGVPLKPNNFVASIGRRTLSGRYLTGQAATAAEGRATARAMEEAEALGLQEPLLPTPKEEPGVYIDRLMKGFKADISAQEQAALAAMKAEHAAHKRAIEDGISRGMTAAESDVNAVLQKLSPEVAGPMEAGSAAHAAATKGLKIGGAEGERLYKIADEANAGRAIDLSPHIQKVHHIAEQMMMEPTQDPAALIAYAQKLARSSPVAKAYDAKLIRAAALPTTVEKSAAVEQATRELMEEQAKTGQQLVIPYEEARAMQKWLGQRLTGKVSDNLEKGRIKYLWKSLTQSMEKGTAGTPGAEAFAEATRHYREFKSIADQGVAAKFVNGMRTTPSDVMKLLSRGPERVLQLRKAIVGYAERTGDHIEQKAAKEAWDQLGRTYGEQHLLVDGIEKLPDKLKHLGNESLDALYGKEVGDNWRQIAGSVSDLKRVRMPVEPPPPGAITPTPKQQTALQNLQDLQGALRIMDTSGSALTSGLFAAGGGMAKWFGLAGLKGAIYPMAAAEATGGLITWAALTRGRTRAFLSAAAEGFRYGAPATMRLYDAYTNTLRDKALLQGGAPKSPPPPPPPPPSGVSRAPLYP